MYLYVCFIVKTDAKKKRIFEHGRKVEKMNKQNTVEMCVRRSKKYEEMLQCKLFYHYEY